MMVKWLSHSPVLPHSPPHLPPAIHCPSEIISVLSLGFHLPPLLSIYYITVRETFLNSYLITSPRHYNISMSIEGPQLKTQALRSDLPWFMG